jgi:putative SOS response-associated peptidase YedK
MCFTLSKDKNIDKINKGSGKEVTATIKDLDKFKPSYCLRAFLNDYIPILKKPTELSFASWGFIQPTLRDSKESLEIKHMTGNAKSFDIWDKKLYKKAIFESRCLIAADGFFEWRHEFNKKYPHYIYHASEPVFLIAGIWQVWKNDDTQEIKDTVSMLTIKANPLMAKIHNTKNSMPLILDKKIAFDWLQPDLTKEQIIELMQPLPENKMNAHTVGRKLNPDSIETLKHVDYPELQNEQQKLF